MSRLESPSIRWTIAFLFLGVELLLFIVIADLHWVNQIVTIIATIFLFAIIPSILEAFSEKGTTPVETTQRQRAAWVAGLVDKVAAIVRIDKVGPIISWIAAAFLVILAGGTVTESVSGMKISMIFSMIIYLLLAAFAAPPVRSAIQEKLQTAFSRPVVVIILTAGVFVNEAILAPPVENTAVIVPFWKSLL